MNQKLFSLALLVLFGITACKEKKQDDHKHHTEAKEQAPADTLKKSIPKEEHAQIGQAHITIRYHAPAVRGRVIWGGLVPFDQVWVTGAHNATSFEISRDFIINNQKIPAGKYAIFTVPGKEKWDVIFNKNWEQHLADEYDAKDDVVRFTVQPTEVNEVQERLYYAIKAQSDMAGLLVIRWEKIQIPVEFRIAD